jgi:hypothetical protein
VRTIGQREEFKGLGRSRVTLEVGARLGQITCRLGELSHKLLVTNDRR